MQTLLVSLLIFLSKICISFYILTIFMCVLTFLNRITLIVDFVVEIL